mgnify:CR=1 FL=1
MYIRHVSFAYFLFFVSLSRSKTVLFDFSEHKKWFFPAPIYKAWLLPPKPRFLRRFFCSLQRKYRAALCITKCSYPRLLLSWGSYAVKNSALIFLLSYSLVTHLLLIQRFLTYFSTILYKTVTSALFLFCFLTLRQAEVLTEKILSIFLFFCLQRAFPSIQRFLPYQFPVKFFCKRRFLPQKTAFAPLPCCLS